MPRRAAEGSPSAARGPRPAEGPESLSDELLLRVAEEHGTPAFVYDLEHVRARAALLRARFERRFALSFSVKSNPNPALLGRLRALVDGLDVSSGGELARALESGWPAGALRFSGPLKREDELVLALERGVTVVLESGEEARALDALARARGARQRVLLRVSPSRLPPGFGVQLAGKPTRFGVDEEEAPAAVEALGRLRGLRLEGFHVFAGAQCLRADALVEHHARNAELFVRLARHAAEPPRELVFGAGFGIPYAERDEPLDLDRLAVGLAPALERLAAALPGARPVLEAGRYLVGEAGLYLTRVGRLKRSRGTLLALCDGGMHHHLAACGLLGGVLHRNYRMFVPGAPREGPEPEPCDLVGPLCTNLDTLGRRVRLRGLVPGCVVAVRSSGAYGPSASPGGFLGHPPAREVLVERDGGRVVLTDAGAR